MIENRLAKLQCICVMQSHSQIPIHKEGMGLRRSPPGMYMYLMSFWGAQHAAASTVLTCMQYHCTYSSASPGKPYGIMIYLQGSTRIIYYVNTVFIEAENFHFKPLITVLLFRGCQSLMVHLYMLRSAHSNKPFSMLRFLTRKIIACSMYMYMYISLVIPAG